MPAYLIGETIREQRLRRNISQEALACNSSTSELSDIENGTAMPSRKTAELYLSRLGVDLSIMNIPLTQADCTRIHIENELFARINGRNFNLGGLLKAYREASDTLDSLEQQLYETMDAISQFQNDSPDGRQLETLCSTFETSLRRSIPTYDFTSPSITPYLSFTERLIVYYHALTCYALGRRDDAVLQLEAIASYYRERLRGRFDKTTLCALVLQTLSGWLLDSGDAAAALRYAEEGSRTCFELDQLLPLPPLFYTRAASLALLGRKDESKRYFSLCFSMMEVCNGHDKTARCAKEAEARYGITCSYCGKNKTETTQSIAEQSE
jgi:transcriptional regulator with XRE-family HTH domain